MRRSLVVICALVGSVSCAVACGSRSQLRGEDYDVVGVDVPRPPDAADVPFPIDRTDVPTRPDVRPPIDVPPDAPIPRVDVTCPAPIRMRQTETAVLDGMATSNVGLPLTFEWFVVSRPMGSSTAPAPANAARARMLLDAGGEWTLRFTGRDSLGNSRSCTVRVFAQPAIELRCPNDQSNYQGATVSLAATARSNFGRTMVFSWTVVSRPTASMSSPVPATSVAPSLVLDALGDWRLMLTATDSAGLRSQCITNVHADPDVIVACPTDQRSSPFATITLAARASSRLGLPLMYRWEIVDQPITSTASIPSPTTLSTPFTFDVAGDWTYRFTATNSMGNMAYCTTRALAASDEAVRVEIVWNVDRACVGCNAMGGDQDIDLHLADVSRSMGHWAGLAPGNSDCYYANCVCGMPGMLCATERLDWPPVGRTNNPQLDIDHVSDLPGPENINVVTAETGAAFDVGVHFYSAHGHTPTTAIVARVYCSGSIAFESEVVRLNERDPGGTSNNLWRVGRVTVTAGGCRFERCGRPGALAECIRPQNAW